MALYSYGPIQVWPCMVWYVLGCMCAWLYSYGLCSYGPIQLWPYIVMALYSYCHAWLYVCRRASVCARAHACSGSSVSVCERTCERFGACVRWAFLRRVPKALCRLYLGIARRHAHCAGMGAPVLKMTACPTRSFWVPALPCPRNGYAVGDVDVVHACLMSVWALRPSCALSRWRCTHKGLTAITP